MKKNYLSPQTFMATYSDMILEVNPGTQNGGEYSGNMPVDAKSRDGYEGEDVIYWQLEDEKPKKGLW